MMKKILVKEDDYIERLKEHGFDDVYIPIQSFDSDGELSPTGEYTKIEIEENNDGTWGWGAIKPISYIEL
jgi:hypothetical protein